MNAPAADAHPNPPELEAYSRGTLDPAADRQIEEHLEQCEECCRTLSSLSSDTLVSLLRRPLPGEPDTRGAVSSGDQATLLHTGEIVTTPPRVGETRNDHSPSPAQFKAALPPELANHARYEILSLVGQGGMGNVYKAQHRLMNRVVALKVINQQLVRSDTAVKRFQREVQAAARLSHPNIVAAHDAEQAGHVHFLVMEYVDGIDLAEVLRRRGPLPVAEACEYIRQAAVGLQHAHELGMVHRDIKPQNLMLTGFRIAEFGLHIDGKAAAKVQAAQSAIVKILDFGLAQLAAEPVEEADPASDSAGGAAQGHLTLTGAMMGTPDYISPEQARDAHSADIRADIYSLGCTLYCLLTGSPPFATGTPLERALAHAEREAKPVSEQRQDLPNGLESAIVRMMAKQPGERFQTPGEVAQALAPFVAAPSGGSIEVRSLDEQNRLKPELQTKRRLTPARALALVGTAALALFVALAGIIVVVTNQGRLEIVSEVEDVQVIVRQGGHEVVTIDLKTGSQVRWLKSGKYELELVGDTNAVKLEPTGFQMTRLGMPIVNAKWNSANAGVVRSFTTTDKPITQDGVTVDDGGWKVAATARRTVRLFEVPQPNLDGGRFFYRAKLRTEGVKGRAYLEMWVRVPGEGESFSKGFLNAVSGTNGWAEYEIPFLLNKGQHPDLVKLNLVVEGTGTVWIKDVELRGRTVVASTEAEKPQFPMAQATDYDRLRGVWECTSGTLGKKPISKEELAQMRLRFDYDEVEIGLPKGGVLKTKYRLGQTQTPRWIEFINPDAKTNGEPNISGIYEFSGESLRVSFDDADRPRPRDFSPTDNRDHFVGTFKRGAGNAPLGAARSNVRVPAGVNLLHDSSFENTPAGGVPNGWSVWLGDGPKFRGQVIEGGRNSKNCLQISGEGTRAVVFSNLVALDRTKRYALKGWAKCEGEPCTRAIIKFNYFHARKWLGANDLVGADSQTKEWQRFEKTDAVDAYPEASEIWVSCNIEGNGKAQFDDLELVAYEREGLAADFDTQHGKHNRLVAALSLDRWVGCWETTMVHKPNAAVARERTAKGATKSRLILDDRVLLSHWKSDDDEEESLSLLTYDENLAAYRFWVFMSNGQVFERTGQWDARAQTLALNLKAPSPGVTGQSTQRFVGPEHIEGTLLVKGADGQVTRDVRFTSHRTLTEVTDDLPLAAGPAKQPAELAVLQKLAGSWSIRVTSKPSVWTPEEKVETFNEMVEWVLGGRFLLFRGADKDQRLTSLSLMTFEPAEKSFHIWFFAPDVAGGQWRISWDESSRGFHWRSIDMPPGWIGTGFNRWVDNDTFDNQALIKDDRGRVMMDRQDTKRRVK